MFTFKKKIGAHHGEREMSVVVRKSQVWSKMSDRERRERLKYLWFRMKVIALGSMFVLVLKKKIRRSY